jgi:hypothetical protein
MIKVEVLVFVPVGPKSNLKYLRDTIDSFLFYFDQTQSALLIINDTDGSKIHDYIPANGNILIFDVDMGVKAAGVHNTKGNLFVNQIQAIRFASEVFDWKIGLRLDDDALITGKNPHVDAQEKFASSPKSGILGAYHYRGDGKNKDKAMAQKGRLLARQLLAFRKLSRFALSLHIASVLARATLHGYVWGHMCTGGSFFILRKAFDKIIGIIPKSPDLLRASILDDDLLFSLYVNACGFKLSDFSLRDDIMAINWQGLPMPLNDLIRFNKKIVHPVKDPDNLAHEADVRSFFRELRF